MKRSDFFKHKTHYVIKAFIHSRTFYWTGITWEETTIPQYSITNLPDHLLNDIKTYGFLAMSGASLTSTLNNKEIFHYDTFISSGARETR